MVAPDGGAIATDIGKTRYRGRMFDVESPQHAKWLKDAGYFQAGLGGVSKTAGHVCGVCGFASFFRDCSRCRDRAE